MCTCVWSGSGGVPVALNNVTPSWASPRVSVGVGRLGCPRQKQEHSSGGHLLPRSSRSFLRYCSLPASGPPDRLPLSPCFSFSSLSGPPSRSNQRNRLFKCVSGSFCLEPLSQTLFSQWMAHSVGEEGWGEESPLAEGICACCERENKQAGRSHVITCLSTHSKTSSLSFIQTTLSCPSDCHFDVKMTVCLLMCGNASGRTEECLAFLSTASVCRWLVSMCLQPFCLRALGSVSASFESSGGFGSHMNSFRISEKNTINTGWRLPMCEVPWGVLHPHGGLVLSSFYKGRTEACVGWESCPRSSRFWVAGLRFEAPKLGLWNA